ncbi:MAG: class I SAM-dependent methyltransferase [Alphaproteobacteria bacterium]|nr:class I SAM-dependent methyltransferase [Alphaproteobacteria bacterium]
MTAPAYATREPGLPAQILAIGLKLVQPRIAGRLSIHLPSGRCLDIGDRRISQAAELHLRSWKTLWRSMRRSSVGFCESFMKGEWDSPAPERVFAFYLQNRESLDRAGRFWMRRSRAVRAWHLRRDNDRPGARRNIEAHYDLGNDFYSLWLDATMTYSSGLFDPGIDDLESAQCAKYRLIADALDLQPGHRMLEIGCGWGGFAKVAAERGAQVKAVTLSAEQLAYGRSRATDRMSFELMDYRDVSGTYDRIASIEMIEAVGESHWSTYFRTLSERLAPGGVAAIQAITIDEKLFPAYRSHADFIQRHIFPGGMLPTVDIIRQQAAARGLTFETVRCFGRDYARTLRLWRERFEKVSQQLGELGFDETFRRKWRLYFCYCEAGFEHGAIDVGVYRLTKPGDGAASDQTQMTGRKDLKGTKK